MQILGAYCYTGKPCPLEACYPVTHREFVALQASNSLVAYLVADLLKQTICLGLAKPGPASSVAHQRGGGGGGGFIRIGTPKDLLLLSAGPFETRRRSVYWEEVAAEGS